MAASCRMFLSTEAAVCSVYRYCWCTPVQQYQTPGMPLHQRHCSTAVICDGSGPYSNTKRLHRWCWVGTGKFDIRYTADQGSPLSRLPRLPGRHWLVRAQGLELHGTSLTTAHVARLSLEAVQTALSGAATNPVKSSIHTSTLLLVVRQ